jgi:hypothetical protein
VDLSVVARERDVVCISDKKPEAIFGYAVRFEDGSWANLLSRSYGGHSSGRVFFLTAPAETNDAAPAAHHEQFDDVVSLELRGSFANVAVEPTDGPAVVEVRGDDAFMSAVAIDEVVGDLSVSWRAVGGEQDTTRSVRCLVPEPCELTIEAHGTGRWWVTAPVSPLRVALGGEATLVCLRASELDIDLNGAGQAFVGTATGSARLRANASGSAIVAGGRLTSLDAAVRSTGSVVVEASVEDAVLSNTASGALVAPAVAQHVAGRHGAGPLVAGSER